MIRFYLSLFSLFILFSACRKSVPRHVMTQVDGIVKDPETGAPMEGVPVAILGEDHNFFGPTWVVLPQKDTTDANGAFSIRFQADGGSKSFKAEAHTRGQEIFYDGTSTNLKTRKYNEVVLFVRRTKVLRLNLKVQQNLYDTLTVQASTPNGITGLKEVYGRTVDTTMYRRYYPERNILIRLGIYDRGISRHKAYYETLRPPQPAVDTFTMNISLSNTADFTLE